MEENMKLWNALKQPPKTALRQITGGRLKGKTDINPQWRYAALTERFGPCGIGWKYEIQRLWIEAGDKGQVLAFAEIALYIKMEDRWSEPIPGIGGSMLITMEKSGLYSSDEAYKMAVTDALSVAMKVLGVGADVYAGLWDGSKYLDTIMTPTKYISVDQQTEINDLIKEVGANKKKFLNYLKVDSVETIPAKAYKIAVALLEAKRKAERQPGEDG
jgi:hypothetical protein